MIAPLAGVVVLARSLLCQSVGLADRRVYVDRQRRVLGACPGVPGARQQLPAHPVQLSHMSPPETAQEGPQRGWSLDHTTQYRGGPARPQHVGVVYAVAASQSGCHQGQYLVPVLARPGASPRSTWLSTSWLKPRRPARVTGRISPALATRRGSSKAIWMRSGWLRGSIYWVLLFCDRFFGSKPLSQIQRCTLLLLQDASHTPPSVDWGLVG